MGYRLNRLDEPIFMAGPKPLRTEFGIHFRLESCGMYCLAWFKGSVAKKVESRGFELVTTPGRLTVQQPIHLPWSSPRSSSWTNGGRHKRHDQQICRGELNQGLLSILPIPSTY